MAKNSWFVADTHFGHANIVRYSKRPFADVAEHDEALIANWNRVVAPEDDVYFLGDFAYKSKASILETRGRLNGAKIHFIKGNHDAVSPELRDTFAWYDSVRMIEVNGQKIWLSHYAHRVWDLSHHGSWHLFGHTHHCLAGDPGALSIDVGIDATAVLLGRPELYGSGRIPDEGLRPGDYRPIHFDEIAALMKRKTFIPIEKRES